MNKVKFTLYAEPQGKGRPRFRTHNTKSGKAFAQTYTPAGTRAYEQLIAQEYRKKYGQEIKFKKDFPLAILINAYCAIPKSASRAVREDMLSGVIFPTKKPDPDNIIKIVLDALNEVAFEDDKQVVNVHCCKQYSNSPRVEVTIIPAALLNTAAKTRQRTEDMQCKIQL